jgi:hypothetical protein
MEGKPVSIDDASVAADARTLAQMLDAAPDRLFAVIDGALFGDLPGDLSRQGLSCQSLFLEHADKEVERAGPWLVELDSHQARGHAGSLATASPCVVFWSGPLDETALWAHLRTLNEALIPVEGDEAAQAGMSPVFEKVMFRHWDPNVLAALMPQLDAGQFARIFGPATYIFMHAPKHGGLKKVPRPENLPEAPHGLLRLTTSQMISLRASILHEDDTFAEWYVEEFMKHNLPDFYYAVSDEGKREMNLNGRRYARFFGFNDGSSQAHFLTLMWTVGANFFTFPVFHNILANPKISPERKIEKIYELDGEDAAVAIMNKDERFWYPELLPDTHEWHPDGGAWRNG